MLKSYSLDSRAGPAMYAARVRQIVCLLVVAEAGVVYRPRRPTESPLFQLLESHYDQVKLEWEARFERRYGYWRGLVDEAVARYLDCGVFERGFARVKCDGCPVEQLVAFSCKGRGLCPSCASKRGAGFGAFLSERVLEPVGHAQWVFTIPKMLRPYFLHHRELLGPLCRAAYETVREVIAEAADDDGVRPGFVAVVQTFNSDLQWNPHIHALASRGGWDRDDRWVPVAHVEPRAAELRFRDKVLRLLLNTGLIDQARVNLLLGWTEHTGFSVHNATTVDPEDNQAIERLARYLLRAPVSLERLAFDSDAGVIEYRPRAGHEHAADSGWQHLDPLDFLARVIIHVPASRLHAVHYFGEYAAVCRARRRARQDMPVQDPPVDESVDESSTVTTPCSRTWAALLSRVFEVDPLLCPRCGGRLRIVALIQSPDVIDRILRHLRRIGHEPYRPP